MLRVRDTNVHTVGRELPLVVQLGFAGSRHLYDAEAHPDINVSQFHAQVEMHLAERLQRLGGELGLTDRHFFCGISQIAIGADTIFSRACAKAETPILQRIFLPQPIDDYLDARGSDKKPDFSDAEKVEARALWDGSNVIQQRILCDSSDRTERFQDVNCEIVRVSDVLVCLVRSDADAKSGGTLDLIDHAMARCRPVLVIRVAIDNGTPKFSESWRVGIHDKDGAGDASFRVPELPHPISGACLTSSATSSLPRASEYCTALENLASPWAMRRQKLFKRAAVIILGTHLVATMCAVAALVLHHQDVSVVSSLLVAELFLLLGGLTLSQILHRMHAVQQWALARLVAEVVRSTAATEGLHLYLEYLFKLPFPESLRPLLRTMNVVHLASSFRSSTDWHATRDRYVQQRMDDMANGQIHYYRDQSANAARSLHRAEWMFFVCSSAAILATFIKLVTLGHLQATHENLGEHIGEFLGALAIVLPILAVAAVSLAAAMDLEARVTTYRETLRFLTRHKIALERTKSRREFAHLVIECEQRLLGETANWYYRRSFTGVA